MEEANRQRQRARPPVGPYLDELARRTKGVLGGRLVGVYAGGSLALGDYQPDRSDVDVAVVVEGKIRRDTKEALVAELRHESLPCPARGLELVVYSSEAAKANTADADFELNLNTGAGMPFREDLEPDPAEAHWFALDRAILRAHGLALVGPPAADVFAQIPREQLLAVTAQSLRWHELGAARTDDAILNACRALRFARENEWSSKDAAGRWALGEVGDRLLVSDALAARSGGDLPDLDRALAFVADVRSELEPAGASRG
jgi:hypothetical protein